MNDLPAWLPCFFCDGFLCTHHDTHADACACPSVEEWDLIGLNPYTDPHPGDDTFKDSNHDTE